MAARSRRAFGAVLLAVIVTSCSQAAAQLPSRAPGVSSAPSPAGSPRPDASPPPRSPVPPATADRSGTEPPANVYGARAGGTLLPGVRGLPDRVFVPNEGDGSVSVIDPRTLKVVRRIRVGGLPHHITPTWDMSQIVVDTMGANRLTIIDPRTLRIVSTVKVASPYNLYFTPDGTKAIVVAESLDRLDVYELPAWRLAHRISTPDRGIDHLDFSADGSYLLASTEFSGTVLRVDLVSMAVTGRLRLGGSTVDVKLAPDGRRFFVANQMRDGVSVVDPLAMEEVAFIHTGRGAHGMVFSADTRRLFVSDRLAGDIAVIDVATLRLITRWHIGGSPDMLILSTLGNRLWVSNRFGGSVSVVDARSGRRLATIATGSSPHGLTYYPQPGAFCIGHNGVTR